MFSVVMMAALTTGMDLPDRGRRGGCRGGCYGCYGGCYGCYGGCYGSCYGMGMAWGGRRMAWGGGYPMMGAYAYWPLGAGAATAFAPGMTQSMYYNPGAANQANEATIIVHLPAEAKLTFDGQATQSTSNTRIFLSPPLERGKTYVYKLRAEVQRDGRLLSEEKTIEIKAGQPSEVRLTFAHAKGQRKERLNEPRDEP